MATEKPKALHEKRTNFNSKIEEIDDIKVNFIDDSTLVKTFVIFAKIC